MLGLSVSHRRRLGFFVVRERGDSIVALHECAFSVKGERDDSLAECCCASWGGILNRSRVTRFPFILVFWCFTGFVCIMFILLGSLFGHWGEFAGPPFFQGPGRFP